MLTGFRNYVESSINTEVQETLDKLPKAHRALTKGYKFKFHDGCTLKREKDAIGMIHLNNDDKREIHVAAPWNYGRQFAMLHEIAHLVYEKYMNSNKALLKKWDVIANKSKDKLKKLDKNVAKQDNEELFCHAYANHYANNKVLKFSHDDWDKFIKALPH